MHVILYASTNYIYELTYYLRTVCILLLIPPFVLKLLAAVHEFSITRQNTFPLQTFLFNERIKFGVKSSASSRYHGYVNNNNLIISAFKKKNTANKRVNNLWHSITLS